MDKDPNALIDAQATPAPPLSPRIKDSAEEEPIKVARAAISMRPVPTCKELVVNQLIVSSTDR
jgi:hypothetical protein